MRTVEDEIEKALFELKYISECNYGKFLFFYFFLGNLQKVGWSRSSRTDKKVSAVFNMISCKLHKYDDEETMKEKINKLMPEDIKIFSKKLFYFIRGFRSIKIFRCERQ